jgi:hypothetical protein
LKKSDYEEHNLCSSSHIVFVLKAKRMRWAGNVALTGETRNAYKILVGKPEWKRSRVSPIRRWKDNIKMDI